MQRNNRLSKKEIISLLVVAGLFLLLTGIFVGLRVEHWLMVLLYVVLFFSGASARKLAVALLPFAVFGISYDWMRVYPNYEVNPIDVSGLYHAEQVLFGVDGMTLCEYFASHHCAVADFFAGLFYLCWVPVPIAFGIWLYVRKHRDLYLHFSLVFLLVNLMGFAVYYIHPAAPPWYAMNYGFDVLLDTPGNPAGLQRFDELTGLSVFDSIYGRNSNVFAAVPSLHAAYMVVTLIYGIAQKCRWYTLLTFAVIMIGIWATAIYSGHHYVIDVLLGIACALLGVLLFEGVLMKLPSFNRFLRKYYGYIR